MKTGVARRTGLWRERQAAIGAVFALMLIPLIGMLGLAIDFGFLVRVKTVTAIATDSAALVASRTAANAFARGDANWQQQGLSAGQTFFTAETASLSPKPQLTNLKISLGNSGGATFTATATFSGQMNSFFARIFKYDTFTYGGTSKTVTPLNFVDIHFLMDNSSSMLVEADDTNLELEANAARDSIAPGNNTSLLDNALRSPQYASWDKYSDLGQTNNGGCVFACHFSNTPKTAVKADGSGTMTVSQDFYGVAQLAGIKLRLNVLQQALGNTLNELLSTQATTNSLYRVAIHTVNDPTGATDNPATAFPLSANLTNASTVARNITIPVTLPNVTEAYQGDTDMTTALKYAASQIGNSTGTGSATERKQFLFLLTDGIYDFNPSGGSDPSNRKYQPIDTTTCAALKKRNVNIFILYTPYVPENWFGFYDDRLSAINPGQVMEALTACASSPQTVFTADSSAAISTQMQKMLDTALGNETRLTQ